MLGDQGTMPSNHARQEPISFEVRFPFEALAGTISM